MRVVDHGAEARSGVLRLGNGRRVGWLDRGAPEGLTALWFHGQPGSRLEQHVLSEDLIARHGLRLVSIDRAGYGDTDAAGTSREVVVADAVAVLDHLGVASAVAIGVSMGGTFALAAAALAPARIRRVVLVSANALPYDDDVVVSDLRPEEREDVALLRRGDPAEIDTAYEAARDALHADPLGVFDTVVHGEFSAREQHLWSDPAIRSVFELEVRHGLEPGHRGYRDDGLRTVAPLDFDLAAVTCPVRAVHGSLDTLEPLSNLRRLAGQLPDAQVFTLEGVNHFGPWLWPDVLAALVTSED